MLIGGIQKTTLIDYPDKVAATIFTIGCNFRCSFCHNPELVKGIAKVIPEDEVLDFLKKRKKLLDAVCITGGEPTMQSGLFSFMKKLKKLGFAVKLDTNGAKPDMLERLIKAGVVDYIAMDIKAPWKRYKIVTCRDIDLDALKKSVKLIIASGLPHEFRSTVLPGLHSKEDILEMAKQVKGAEKYFLQQFLPAKNLVNAEFLKEKTFSKKALNDILQEFKNDFKVCKVR
jgi:pyruvate formate lyase activating enzyme